MSQAANLHPLQDVIIVRPDDPEQISAGGIVLAPSSQEEALQGTVIAVGPGRLLESGYRVPMDLRPGDRVAFSKYAKEHFTHEGVKLITMREADVIGVIDGGA